MGMTTFDSGHAYLEGPLLDYSSAIIYQKPQWLLWDLYSTSLTSAQKRFPVIFKDRFALHTINTNNTMASLSTETHIWGTEHSRSGVVNHHQNLFGANLPPWTGGSAEGGVSWVSREWTCCYEKGFDLHQEIILSALSIQNILLPNYKGSPIRKPLYVRMFT